MDGKLPVELVLEVLEYLRHDTRSLRACSLVDRGWLDSSRSVLHSRLRLSSTLVSNQTFDDLETIPSALTKYVRQLEVDGNGSPAFLQVLLKVPTTLVPGNLKELSISAIHFPDPIPFLDVVAACERLSFLSLSQVRWTTFADNGVPLSFDYSGWTFPRSLTRLRFWRTEVRVVLYWALSKGEDEAPIITKLAVDPVDRDAVFPLGSFVRNRGHLIQNFGVAHGRIDVASMQGCAPNLQHFVDLQTIYIRRVIEAGDDGDAHAAMVVPFLCALRSKTLHTVVLELAVARVGQIDGTPFNWSALDEALASGPYLSQVRSLVFHVTGKANLEGVENLIAIRLPLASRRGILSCFRDYSSPFYD